MAMSDETPKRYVFIMYCKQNTFTGYHLQVRMYTRCHHDMEKSGFFFPLGCTSG
jgi:hypothetical protein